MDTAKSAPLLPATSKNHSWKLTLLLVALAATAVVAPFFFFGSASGHDIQFHLASWMDVSAQWHEGAFYPRWAEWADWGFGEPRFIFYPPLSWIIGAVLGSALPWAATPGAYIWLTLIAAGMAMWKLAREWLPPAQATAAAVFFAVSPYNLALVYYRSDFAELLGLALFPLLLWAAVRLISGDWRRAPHISLIFAAIWLSNAPEGVIATYSLALVIFVATLRQRKVQPLISGTFAILAGFGLAAFYILPAAYERHWVQISQALTANLQPQQNFLFTHSSDAAFQLFNWKISSVAVGTMLATFFAAIFTAKHRQSLGKAWWMLLGLAIASSLGMFPVSGPLWRHLPELAFLQFPWRWLGPLSIAFAFFAAASLARLTPGRNQRIATAALVLVIAVAAALIGTSTWWNSEDAALIAGEIRAGHGYQGVDEYQPVGDDLYNLPNATPDAEELPDVPATPDLELFDSEAGQLARVPPNVRIHTDVWTSVHKRFSVSSAEPLTLAPRLLNYPAWQVRVDDALAHTDSAPETAQMLVPLPPGDHRVEIDFARTPDRTLGDTLSAVSALGILAFALICRGRGKAPLKKEGGA